MKLKLDENLNENLRERIASAGIVVLRARNGLMTTLLELVDTMLEALRRDSPKGRLWIVEPGKLRIHLER